MYHALPLVCMDQMIRTTGVKTPSIQRQLTELKTGHDFFQTQILLVYAHIMGVFSHLCKGVCPLKCFFLFFQCGQWKHCIFKMPAVQRGAECAFLKAPNVGDKLTAKCFQTFSALQRTLALRVIRITKFKTNEELVELGFI